MRTVDTPTDGRRMTKTTYSITITTVTQNGNRPKVSHNASGCEALLTHPNIIQVHDVGGR